GNRSTVVSTPARCRPRPCSPPKRSRPTPRNCAGAPRRRRRSTARVLEAHDRDRRNPPLGCEPRERRVVVRIPRSCAAAKVVARTVQKGPSWPVTPASPFLSPVAPPDGGRRRFARLPGRQPLAVRAGLATAEI